MSILKAGLGSPDIDSWNMIEKIAERNNLGYKQLVSQNAMFAFENWLLAPIFLRSLELSSDQT